MLRGKNKKKLFSMICSVLMEQIPFDISILPSLRKYTTDNSAIYDLLVGQIEEIVTKTPDMHILLSEVGANPHPEIEKF